MEKSIFMVSANTQSMLHDNVLRLLLVVVFAMVNLNALRGARVDNFYMIDLNNCMLL